MISNIDRIAKVDISLDTPAVGSDSFDHVLILGEPPKGTHKDLPLVAVYESLKEVTEAGFAADGDNPDPVGVAAMAAFSQSPRPHEVYIAVIGEAENTDTGETEKLTAVQVLEKAENIGDWYCICPVGIEKNALREVIQWTETRNKLCVYIDDDMDSPVVEAGLYCRSAAFYPKEYQSQPTADIPLANRYGIGAAVAVKAMYYHAGEETWSMLPLAGIAPSQLSGDFVNKLGMANVSYVMSVAGKTVSTGGKTNGGEWIDIIRFRDWLQNDMQKRIINLLIVNPKIPYTDAGIGLVENQMIASLKQGQLYGGICQTEYDAEGNANEGYLTSVPLAAEISSEQKATRVLENCRFTARLAGAIHCASISGSLHYENLLG